MVEKKEYIAKTLMGLEEVLAEEIKDLGGEQVEILKRAVKFTAAKKDFYKANMWLRTALKILLPIKKFTIRDEDDLYLQIKKIRWEDYFSVDNTFAIDAVTNNSPIPHSKYAALRTKDAIVDRFRDKFGKRPSIDRDFPDLQINLHIYKNQATLSLDACGTPLSKRGYRAGSQHVAPINEVLAAGLVLLSGWKGETPLIDPFCGSGTILIEAAMIAHDIPPNFLRENYCFMNWRNFDEDLWDQIVDEADDIKIKKGIEITGYDISSRVTRQAMKNSVNSAVPAGLIKIDQRDFTQDWKPEKAGTIITNPPYGERIDTREMRELYNIIGSRLKQDFEGFNAWIISGSPEGMKSIGLRPAKKIPMLNGAIECKYQKFEMYRGSKKAKHQA